MLTKKINFEKQPHIFLHLKKSYKQFTILSNFVVTFSHVYFICYKNVIKTSCLVRNSIVKKFNQKTFFFKKCFFVSAHYHSLVSTIILPKCDKETKQKQINKPFGSVALNATKYFSSSLNNNLRTLLTSQILWRRRTSRSVLKAFLA